MLEHVKRGANISKKKPREKSLCLLLSLPAAGIHVYECAGHTNTHITSI